MSISRRDALKSMGAIGALNVLPPGADRTARFLESLEEQQPAQPYRPKFFNAHEWRTVRVLVDYIIPRDERSGSATDARVPEYMDFVLLDPVMTSDANRIAFHGGLGWMDIESRRRYPGKSFIQATDAERRLLLDDLAYPRKAKPEHAIGVAFFSRLRDMTASGFFSSEMGWKDLRYLGNTFNPNWDGCPPEANRKLGVSQDLMNTKAK
ncbi:MAG: gluconate 2-dehydrogenase subunit 3 family protein [Gemmatimonadota bacterium]